jgi:aminoglycoside phosphotransferase family enzyme
MNQRIITNKRRDGHGDLNATNIFLYQEPVIVDCIEFNRSLRQIDVLNEIAFLCVDLDFYGDPGLSEYFYRQYLREWGEEESDFTRKLFFYYKSYRANVIAKIAAIRARNEEGQKPVHDMKKYLLLMESYSKAISS